MIKYVLLFLLLLSGCNGDCITKCQAAGWARGAATDGGLCQCVKYKKLIDILKEDNGRANPKSP